MATKTETSLRERIEALAMKAWKSETEAGIACVETDISKKTVKVIGDWDDRIFRFVVGRTGNVIALKRVVRTEQHQMFMESRNAWVNFGGTREIV